MEKMSVLRGFDEYEGTKLVRHKKGEELTVSNERAEHLRDAKLARAKPQPRFTPETTVPAPATDPETTS